MHKLRLFFIGVSLLMIFVGHAQVDWELAKEKNGIKVYTKSNKKSDFKSFRATVYMNCSIERFVFEILNLDDFVDWGYKISEVKLLERHGDTVQIYYAKSKVSFPFKARDGIYKNIFKWNSDNQTLTILIEILPNFLPKSKENERVKGSGYWKVVSKAKNKQFVTFEMHLDPGGGIPSWLANIFVTDSPYSTMLDLKKHIEKEKEIKVHYNFIN